MFQVSTSQVATAQVEPLGGYVIVACCTCITTNTQLSHHLIRASGVGESIVQYVDKTKQDMLVMGSRGMGAVKRCVVHHCCAHHCCSDVY